MGISPSHNNDWNKLVVLTVDQIRSKFKTVDSWSNKKLAELKDLHAKARNDLKCEVCNEFTFEKQSNGYGKCQQHENVKYFHKMCLEDYDEDFRQDFTMICPKCQKTAENV